MMLNYNCNLQNKYQLYNKGQIDYDEAYKYQLAMNITRGVAIGCGVFWGYELIRYLIAANSVLPQKAKRGPATEFIIADNTNQTNTTEDNSTEKNTIDDGDQQ